MNTFNKNPEKIIIKKSKPSNNNQKNINQSTSRKPQGWQ